MFSNTLTKVHAKDAAPESSAPNTQTQSQSPPPSLQNEAAATKDEVLRNKSSNSDTSSTPTKAEESTPKNVESSEAGEHKFLWMVKPCSFYKYEYKDCKSFKERFNQYFIYGEKQECDHWKTDYDNCTRWEKNQDKDALDKLIERELSRTRERLRNHYRNNVWENREKPPEGWNAELPDAIKQDYELTYLYHKNLEIKKEEEEKKKTYAQILADDSSSSCIVM